MITIYSTEPPCPKCKVIEKKLNQVGIEYDIINDAEQIKRKGYGNRFMPLVEVDGKLMEFAEAVKWANEKGKSL